MGGRLTDNPKAVISGAGTRDKVAISSANSPTDPRWMVRIHDTIDTLDYKIISLNNRLQKIRLDTLNYAEPLSDSCDTKSPGLTIQEALNRLSDLSIKLDDISNIVSDLETL